jgi:hypothetical protein
MEEVEKDDEGMQAVKALGQRFVDYLLREKVDSSHGKTPGIVPSRVLREEKERSLFEQIAI